MESVVRKGAQIYVSHKWPHSPAVPARAQLAPWLSRQTHALGARTAGPTAPHGARYFALPPACVFFIQYIEALPSEIVFRNMQPPPSFSLPESHTSDCPQTKRDAASLATSTHPR